MSASLLCIASGGTLVDLDGTVFIQLAIFFVMFIFLQFALYRPVMRLIAARREATEGKTDKAYKLSAEAAALAADVDQALAKLRTSAAAERRRMLDAARQTEREIADAAREASRREMASARVKMKESAEAVREQLKKELGSLADAVVSRMMNRAG